VQFAQVILSGVLANVTMIYLNENEIGDPGMDALAEALAGCKKTPKLQSLILQGNPARQPCKCSCY